MNIILVIFDTLRKDCVGVYGEPPWGKVHTPHLDAFAKEALVFDKAYPEALPTLPARRAIYTAQRVYPFHNGDFKLKGDFVGAPGWGPIPESMPTLAEMLREEGYRTGLVSDVYHQFKPSKNYWRGFDQWVFLRGQENDPYRSGPMPSQAEIDHWLAPELQAEHPRRVDFIRQCLMNMHDRTTEEDYFVPRVMQESCKWLQQNIDADKLFLTIESFDPHEPWFVPEHYRKMYDPEDGQEEVVSYYSDAAARPDLLRRKRANYSGLVTMCDRWFGHLMGTIRSLGLLENSVVIVTSDHGHSIGDRGYGGKRPYPSDTAVYDIPLMVRLPDGAGAGKRSDMIVQHTDVGAQVLDFAGLKPEHDLHGMPFCDAALSGIKLRDHATIGWGTGVTVVDDNWYFNSKVDGTGAFLFDIKSDPRLEHNILDRHPEEAKRLYKLAVEDAEGGFPEFLMELCRTQADAPGCSSLAARD